MNDIKDKEKQYEIEVTKDDWCIATTYTGSQHVKLQQYGRTQEEAEEKLDKLFPHDEE